MTIADVIRLSIIFIGGIVSTYTDFKKGKIYNKVTLIMFVSGILFGVYDLFNSELSYVLNYMVNTVLVCFISIAFYLFHIWAGGDTKLLCSLAVLYPPSMYCISGKSFFSLSYMVVLILSCGFIYTMAESIVLKIKDKKTANFSELKKSFVFSLVNYLKTMIYVTAVGHLFNLFVFPYLKIAKILFMMISVLIVFTLHKTRIFDSVVLIVVSLIFDILMSFFTGDVMINRNAFSYVLITTLMLIRIFINSYNYKEIDTESVEKNMVLSRSTTMMFINSRVKGLPAISDETLKSRITGEEAESIKRWKNSKYGLPTIVIVRKLPFAVFIFLGFVVYLCIGWYFK